MVILACGNLRLGEEAAGVLVGRQLREWGFTVVDFAGDGLELLEQFRMHREMYLIAAVATGQMPGTIHIWDEADSPVNPNVLRCCARPFGIPQAVRLGRRLGRLPAKFRVYGVETRPGTSAELSSEVLRSINQLAGLIAIELSDRLK